MGRLTTVFSLSAVLAVSLSSAVQAGSVYGTAASLTGERHVVNGELVVADATHRNLSESAWDEGGVQWDITPTGSGYAYTYTFWNFKQPEISHLTLDLTDDAVNDADAVTDVAINGSSVSLDDIAFGDLEGIVGGVKIDAGDDGVYDDKMILTFTSNRAPVWGDISIEQGQDQAGSHFLVVNAGFGDQTLEDASQYVARPNGISIVTTPTPTAATAGLVMLGALMLRRQRRCRSLCAD